jgi:hypothetical protein
VQKCHRKVSCLRRRILCSLLTRGRVKFASFQSNKTFSQIAPIFLESMNHVTGSSFPLLLSSPNFVALLGFCLLTLLYYFCIMFIYRFPILSFFFSQYDSCFGILVSCLTFYFKFFKSLLCVYTYTHTHTHKYIQLYDVYMCIYLYYCSIVLLS